MGSPTSPAQATLRPSGSGVTMDVVIDRQPEARRIGDAILGAVSARHRTVVLHGGPGSGTTELVTRWVVPYLRARSGGRFSIWYGQCSAGFPDRFEGGAGSPSFEDLIATPSVVIVDRFTAVFELPRDERRAVLDRVFQTPATGSGTVVVLITDSRQLTSVYALSSYDPGITDAVFEVAPVNIGDGLRQLSAVHPESAVTCTQAVQQALVVDAAAMQEQGWPVTIELIKLVDARFRARRAGSAERSIEPADYKAVGGLTGMLRSHLEEELDRLFPEEADQEIARAVLDDVTEARGEIAAPDFGELPPRLGVAPAQVAAALERLAGPGGLVSRVDGETYRLVPPHLALIIRDDLRRRVAYADRIRRLVDEAERSWSQVGNLPPRERFLEVHRARTQLILGGGQVHFLLQAALHLEDAESAGASAYWLRRVEDPVHGIDLLLAALFSEHRHVRLRAARLLRDFPGREVRERLSVLALTDSDPEVRDQAVTSLQPMSDTATLELFMSAARDAGSAHRLAAIDALRISSGEDVVRLLQALVNDPGSDVPVRQRAIAVLATIGTKPSADALLAIALHDRDEPDRTAAAAAIGRTSSDELNQHVLRSIGPPSPRGRLWLTRAVLAVLACAGSMSFFSFGEAGATVVAALWFGSLVLVYPTRRWLLGLRAGRIERTSVSGLLGIAAFAVSAISLIFLLHGLAHVMIGRWRRGLLLLVLELAGVLFFFGVAAIVDSVPGLEALWAFYLAAGTLLFFGSYAYDVVVVLFETVVLTGSTRFAARQAAVYRAVMGNPRAAQLVFAALRGSQRSDVLWAKSLLRRFGASLDTQQLVELIVAREPVSLPLAARALRRSKADATVRRLEEVWQDADQDLRRWIADVLCRRPTQRSLDALDRVRGQLGSGTKLRLAMARWYFRLGVWPLPAWALVVLGVPTAVVLAYHGVKVFTNPAWSQIVSLNFRTIPDGEMVRTVEILSQHYPDASAAVLHDHFRSGKHGWRPAVHAAIARGLIAIHDSGTTACCWDDEDAYDHLPAIHDELMLHADDFYGLLAAEDSATAVGALGVLRAMADAQDSALGERGASLLIRFVLASSSDSAYVGPAEAIRALAGASYERALPALDRLLAERKGGPLEGAIRQQLDSVIEGAYRRLETGEAGVEGGRFLAVLEGLRYRSARRLEEVQRLVGEGTARCDRDGDGRCDDADAALERIAEEPSAEYGYTDLLNHYVTEGRYAAAESVLTALRTAHPVTVWSWKALAMLYHEYLPVLDSAWSDTLAFRRSYEEMQGLRRLPAYAALRADTSPEYLRIEADFLEIALSARRYAELEAGAARLLQVSDQPVHRLNVALFLYIARVMRGDRAAAAAALDQVERVVASLGPEYYNNWVYPGTILFIQRSAVPDQLRRAMIDLCREGYWYSPEEAARVLEANRQALPLLPNP